MQHGLADVIPAFSGEGRIAADRLLISADPRQALPPYDAVILISPQRAHEERLRAALLPTIAATPVGAMRAGNDCGARDTQKVGPAGAPAELAREVGLRK